MTTMTATYPRQTRPDASQVAPLEARSNADGAWVPCNAWTVLARWGASSRCAHNYCVTTPTEALAVYEAERAAHPLWSAENGYGEPERIIPDPAAYTQQIRILPETLAALDPETRRLLGV